MICKNCGIEITSEKIWKIHQKECKPIDYTELPYQELKKLASSKGINTLKMTKENIIKSLEG